MGVIRRRTSLPGSLTPACNECGVALCWDISEEEYEENHAFWDSWICEDCNGGTPYTSAQKRPIPPLLIPRKDEGERMSEDKKLAALARMREPFAPNQISKLCRSTKRDNPKGSCKVCGGYHGLPAIALDYVGHAALTDRLLECDPLWTWEPLAVDATGYPVIDRDGGMWIKLTVAGVTRLGYGDAQGKTGGDAMKERIGDALRNAAMRFGAALDLWHKGDLHVDEEAPTPPQGQKGAKSAPQGQKAAQGNQGQGQTKEPATAEQLAKIADLVLAIQNRDGGSEADILKAISLFPGTNGDIWLTPDTLEKKCTKGYAGKIIGKAEAMLK